MLERIGDGILIYANGISLTTITDSTYLNGQVGLFIISNKDLDAGMKAEAAFDNFLVREINK